jgi:hydrogenase maturation protein HypF
MIYDGTGLGNDGTIWGGEILRADRKSFDRIGHLAYMRMPGGDAATLNPGRMAAGALWESNMDMERICPWMDKKELMAVQSMLKANVSSPSTSSMGRLFDACSAILDVCRRRTYEGQPAIELEGIASRDENGSYEVELAQKNGMLIMDGRGLLMQVVEERDKKVPKSIVAARFHNAVADFSGEAAGRLARQNGIERIVLSGGCFNNRLLTERLVRNLKEKGLCPVLHRILPPGDECVSYGQVLYAASCRENGFLEVERSAALTEAKR